MKSIRRLSIGSLLLTACFDLCLLQSEVVGSGCYSGPVDMSSHGDMGTPNPPPPTDMGPPIATNGCANTGTSIKMTDEVYACPGTFLQGNGEQLCGQGWYACTDLKTVTLAQCKNLPGNFAFDQPVIWKTGTQPSSASCGTTMPGSGWGWSFCGKGGAAYTYTSTNPCNGYVQIIDCSTNPLPNTYWSCFAGTHMFNEAINKVPTDGIMCCRPPIVVIGSIDENDGITE